MTFRRLVLIVLTFSVPALSLADTSSEIKPLDNMDDLPDLK